MTTSTHNHDDHRPVLISLAALIAATFVAVFVAHWYLTSYRPAAEERVREQARVTVAIDSVRASLAGRFGVEFKNIEARRGAVCGQVSSWDGKGGSTGPQWFVVLDAAPTLPRVDQPGAAPAARQICGAFPSGKPSG